MRQAIEPAAQAHLRRSAPADNSPPSHPPRDGRPTSAGAAARGGAPAGPRGAGGRAGRPRRAVPADAHVDGVRGVRVPRRPRRSRPVRRVRRAPPPARVLAVGAVPRHAGLLPRRLLRRLDPAAHGVQGPLGGGHPGLRLVRGLLRQRHADPRVRRAAAGERQPGAHEGAGAVHLRVLRHAQHGQLRPVPVVRRLGGEDAGLRRAGGLVGELQGDAGHVAVHGVEDDVHGHAELALLHRRLHGRAGHDGPTANHPGQPARHAAHAHVLPHQHQHVLRLRDLGPPQRVAVRPLPRRRLPHGPRLRRPAPPPLPRRAPFRPRPAPPGLVLAPRARPRRRALRPGHRRAGVVLPPHADRNELQRRRVLRRRGGARRGERAVGVRAADGVAGAGGGTDGGGGREEGRVHVICRRAESEFLAAGSGAIRASTPAPSPSPSPPAPALPGVPTPCPPWGPRPAASSPAPCSGAPSPWAGPPGP